MREYERNGSFLTHCNGPRRQYTTRVDEMEPPTGLDEWEIWELWDK